MHSKLGNLNMNNYLILWVIHVCVKIVIDNKIIEQVILFKYLGNMISCEGELYIDNKLNNFLKITGILNNMFRPQKTLRKQE